MVAIHEQGDGTAGDRQPVDQPPVALHRDGRIGPEQHPVVIHAAVCAGQMADPIRRRRIDRDGELAMNRRLVVGVHDQVLGIQPREIPVPGIARAPDGAVGAADAGVAIAASGNANGTAREGRVQHRRQNALVGIVDPQAHASAGIQPPDPDSPQVVAGKTVGEEFHDARQAGHLRGRVARCHPEPGKAQQLVAVITPAPDGSVALQRQHGKGVAGQFNDIVQPGDHDAACMLLPGAGQQRVQTPTGDRAVVVQEEQGSAHSHDLPVITGIESGDLNGTLDRLGLAGNVAPGPDGVVCAHGKHEATVGNDLFDAGEIRYIDGFAGNAFHVVRHAVDIPDGSIGAEVELGVSVERCVRGIRKQRAGVIRIDDRSIGRVVVRGLAPGVQKAGNRLGSEFHGGVEGLGRHIAVQGQLDRVVQIGFAVDDPAVEAPAGMGPGDEFDAFAPGKGRRAGRGRNHRRPGMVHR